MLDVDEYLKQLDQQQDFDNNPHSESIMTSQSSDTQDKKKSKDSEYDNCSSADTTKQYNSGTLNNKTRVGSSSSSKHSGLYGKNSKDMKQFMKKQLSKTKQDSVYMVCKNIFLIFIASSSIGKSRYQAPKKKKESNKNQKGVNRRNSSLRRNGSSMSKRPPLKPNLKGNRGASKTKKEKVEKESEARRASINTNPFKPPRVPNSQKPPLSKKTLVKEPVEKHKLIPKEETKYESDDEIQSDYGIIGNSENQSTEITHSETDHNTGKSARF